MTDRTRRYAQSAVIILAVLASLYTLHVARDVLLPITLAFIFALLFSPAVNRLASLGVPRGLSALGIIVTSLGFFAGSLYLLSEPAMQWLLRAPEAAESISQHMQGLQKEVSEVDAATKHLESLGTIAGKPEQKVIVTPKTGWRTDVWIGARNFVTYGALSIILLFFLLTSGQTLLVRFIQTLPTRQDKQQTIDMARLAQTQMSRYLLTITMVNTTVGVITGIGLWLIDFPDPFLWAVVAAVMRFVPYLGVSLTVAVLGLISAITYATPWLVLTAPLGYLALTSFFGQVIDPLVHGKRFSLNPIIVFVWIFFWGWLWGAPGVLLAVPLLTLFQLICEQSPRLQPVAHIISDKPHPLSHENNSQDQHL